LSVEGIEDENRDREIEECEHSSCVERQPSKAQLAFRIVGHGRQIRNFRLDNGDDARSLHSDSLSLGERESPVGMTIFIGMTRLI
jgi:hypothetical protein